MPSLSTELFHLRETLESGQIFRFWPSGTGFLVAHRGDVFTVSQNRDTLSFTDIKRKSLINFFRLDEDHHATISSIGKDTVMKQALGQHAGLRILRQDPWECSISFICSSLSNIKRIRQNMELLCTKYGTPTGSVALFPAQSQLPKRISIRAGFREKYLAKAKNMLTEEFFAQVRELPYPEAKKQLMTVPGIGSKVADCILLFSFDRLEAFPVDVWIKRIVEQQYLKQKTPEKKIEEFGRSYFGSYAGYAQQYLYHWGRNVR